MSRTTWTLTIGAVLLAAAAFWVATDRGEGRLVLDLIDALPEAVRSPSPDAFSVVEATVQGETRRAILVSEPSRLTWSIDVPDEAWLAVGFGLDEASWTVEGDGVLFQVGVSDGEAFDELFSLVANPFANPADRAWHDVIVDLHAYAGRRVDLILNTRSGPPDPPADDRRGDAALWAAPRLLTR